MRAIVRLTLTNLLFLVLVALSQVEAAPAVKLENINQHAIAAQSDSVYLVKQGDTYYSLARRFQIPLDSLQRWNNNTLQIGQTLYLTSPKKKKAVAAATAKPAPKTAPKASAPVAKSSAASTPKRAVESSSAAPAPAPKPAAYKTKSRVLVIPFDPHLYFSDSDYEIARQSKIPRQNVRHVFRGRLNAMLAPDGYETIHLLGGVYRDSVSELSRIYGSLRYDYQDNKQSRFNHQPVVDRKSVV